MSVGSREGIHIVFHHNAFRVCISCTEGVRLQQERSHFRGVHERHVVASTQEEMRLDAALVGVCPAGSPGFYGGSLASRENLDALCDAVS